MLNALLVADVKPDVDAPKRYAVLPLPGRLILKLVNVAMPATAATDFVPESTAPPVPVPAAIDTVTFPVNVFTTLLN
jgi:hypothetical protein